MDAGVLPSAQTPDYVLREARLLNSDIGRHSVKCNFSSRLAGRFYKNGSLERHTLRKSRLVEMQARKRQLERELLLEERRVKLLEERLSETERAREDAHDVIGSIERGTVTFQSFVRRRQAMGTFQTMRREARLRESVARSLQLRYRGWKGRLRAEYRREHLRRERREECATAIQAIARRQAQRRIYFDLLADRRRLRERSATAVQATWRGRAVRRRYLEALARRRDAAVDVQRTWRGALGRVVADGLRQELTRKRAEEVRPKRVPLHLRKYSTYGAGGGGGGVRRLNRGKRDPRLRRRSSDAMIVIKDGRLATLAGLKSSASMGDPDENDSIASTMTALTNATEVTGGRRARPPSVQSSSWPTPQRVLASGRRLGGGAGCRRDAPPSQQPRRRGSIEGRRRISMQGRDEGGPSIPSGTGGDRRRSREQGRILWTRVESGSSGTSVPQARKADLPPPKMGRCIAATMATAGVAREEAPRAVTVSEEASLIVQEVLGEGVMRHGIVHSVFDDEFSEHDDDLE